MRMANFFFDRPIEEILDEYEKMLEIENAGVSFICNIAIKLYLNISLCRSVASSATQLWYNNMPSTRKPELWIPISICRLLSTQTLT